ncbi:CHAT domain-containing protein [soil metagenome]
MNVEHHRELLIRAEQAYRDVTADPRHGRPLAEQIATAARHAGAAEALTVALRAAGWAARELYDHAAAKRHLDEAVRVATAEDLADRLCEALITRSVTYLEMGYAGKAQRDLAEAERRATPRSQIEVAFATGLVQDIAGNLDAAVRAYRRVLVSPDDDRQDLRFKALNNLGLVVLRLGRYDEAEQTLAHAEQLAATFSPAFKGFAAESRATAALERGQPQEALRRYERAERILTDIGVQIVDLYVGKANALLQLQLLDEASIAARQAVRRVDGLSGGPLMLAEALMPLARIALANGDLDDAAEAAIRAEQLFRQQRRSGWRARASLLRAQIEYRKVPATIAMADRLARIERTMRTAGNVPAVAEAALLHGQVAAALGRPRRAVAALDRAAAAFRGPVLLRLQGRLATAIKAELEGDRRRMSQACRRGLEELAAYRATFASAELRARAATHGSALAELGLRAAVRSGRTEGIWAWMERSRAVVTVREGSPDLDDEVRPDLAQLRGLERDLGEVAPDDLTEQTSLLRRITQLERRIRNQSWTRTSNIASVTMPSTAALRALRSELTECALLQYVVLDDSILGVAISADRMRTAEIGPLERVRASGQQLAFALRRLSQPRSRTSVDAAFASARHELSQLDEILTAPFSEMISAAQEVVVAPPATLIGVPWGALRSLTGRAVRVAPTATLWQLTKQRAPVSDTVVLVAGPELPTAPLEVQAIASCYANARVLTGAAATADAVQANASGARMVHVACHGRLRRDTAAFSSLQLTDGPLTVYDLEQLNEPAHHWVLAACDLGSPGALVGSELDGVLATLLFGGAAGVVAAVVSVPDLETGQLMQDLHGALASGASLAHAVQAARDRADVTEPTGFVASIAFSCYGGG